MPRERYLYLEERGDVNDLILGAGGGMESDRSGESDRNEESDKRIRQETGSRTLD